MFCKELNMWDAQELENCTKALETVGGFDWLLNASGDFLGITEIMEGYHTSRKTVVSWFEGKQIPGAFQEPTTNIMRFPRRGLIVFFGRLVMPSFRAA